MRTTTRLISLILLCRLMVFGQLSTCTVTGTLYTVTGQPASGVTLRIVRVVKSGQVITQTPVSVTSNSSGVVSFAVPRDCTAYIYANVTGLNTNGSAGVALAIPNAATASLESLVNVASVPTAGLTLQDEGTALTNLVGTVNFVGATVTATQASPGVATITISGGGDVSSVFGRTGAVVAASNDYNWAQINKTTSSIADITTRSAGDLSSGTLPDGRFPAVLPAVSGVNLTNLDAANIAAGILSSARGGTGSGFAKFSGPATSEKTFTLPNASATVLTTNDLVTVPQGGTGVGTLTGLVKGNGTSAFSAAAAGTDYVAPGSVTSTGLTQNTNRLLGRSTASSGAIEEISIGSGLSLSGGSLSASGGGGTPGGATTNVQFNDAGAFGGNAGFVYDKTAQSVSLTPAANSTPLTISGASLTGSSAQPLLSLAGTWNTSGTPTAVTLNITDTTSNAASALLDLQIGGASKFKVGKTTSAFTSASATTVQIVSAASQIQSLDFYNTTTLRGYLRWDSGAPGLRLFNQDNSDILFGTNNTTRLILKDSTSQALLSSGWSFVWGSSGPATPDVGLNRPAANTILVSNASTGVGNLLHGRKIVAKTADYTILNTDSNSLFTNTGASTGVVLTMVSPAAGLTYEFYRDANQTMTVDIAAGVTIRVGTSLVTTDGGNVTLDAVGSKLRITAISTTQWVGELTGTATFN